MVSITPIPAFSDNYIWAIHNETSCYVVDPGDHRAVERFLADHSLILAGILITHHHADHTGGIQELTTNNPLPVYGPKNPSIKGLTDSLKENDQIIVLGNTYTVIATPGHTLDHIAYYTASSHQQPALFCGDTLFSAGCGRLFEGTAQQMQQSLDKLAALPENTQIFCAHEYTQANLAFAITVEPDNTDLQARMKEVNQLRQQGLPSVPSSLATEKKTNPFLRTRNTPLSQQIINQTQGVKKKPAAVLEVIRSMKDNFW